MPARIFPHGVLFLGLIGSSDFRRSGNWRKINFCSFIYERQPKNIL